MEPAAPSRIRLIIEGREAAASGRGERIRRAAELTQADIARAVGVQPAAVSHWETGLRRPLGPAAVRYALTLREIAAHLGGETDPARRDAEEVTPI